MIGSYSWSKDSTDLKVNRRSVELVGLTGVLSWDLHSSRSQDPEVVWVRF